MKEIPMKFPYSIKKLHNKPILLLNRELPCAKINFCATTQNGTQIHYNQGEY